jgi:hypothetical protein
MIDGEIGGFSIKTEEIEADNPRKESEVINKVSVVIPSHVRHVHEQLRGIGGRGAQAFLTTTAKPPVEAAADERD